MCDDKCIKYLDALCCQSRYCEQMCHYCGTSLVLFLHSTDEWKQTEAKRGQFGSLTPPPHFSAHFCQQKPGLSLTPARWIELVEICPLQFHHGEIRRGNITDQFTYTVVGLRHPPLPLRSPSLSDSYCLESGWQDWCGSVNQEWARVALSPSHIYHPQNGD